MFDAGNNNQLNFLPKQAPAKEIYKNFAIFTVTVPLVLPTGTKDAEKFTKISQYSQ